MEERKTFTNGELGIMLENSISLMTVEFDNVKENFKGVHKRQDKTNGRVGKLEKWRWGIGGGLVLFSIMLTALIAPLTIQYFKDKGLKEQNADQERRINELEQILKANL